MESNIMESNYERVRRMVCTPNCTESPDRCICARKPMFQMARLVAWEKDKQFSDFMNWYYENKTTDEQSRRTVTDLMYEWYKQKPNEPEIPKGFGM